MKAQKVIVTIEIEALSIDVVRGMLADVSSQIEREAESGKLSMQDGDSVSWRTTRKDVEF